MESRIAVLLCEDDEASARLVRLALERIGVHVTRVADGREAWRLLEEGLEAPVFPYDVVLLDWMLPGLEGPEILRRLREAQEARGLSGPCCVGLTARSRNDQERHGFYPDEWISKPFDLDELRALVLSKGSATEKILTMSGARLSFRDPALQIAYLAYRDDLVSFQARWRRCLESQDLEALRALAHTLAGTAPTYGFRDLGEEAAALEARAVQAGLGPALFQDPQVLRLSALLESAIASYGAESAPAE